MALDRDIVVDGIVNFLKSIKQAHGTKEMVDVLLDGIKEIGIASGIELISQEEIRALFNENKEEYNALLEAMLENIRKQLRLEY